MLLIDTIKDLKFSGIIIGRLQINKVIEEPKPVLVTERTPDEVQPDPEFGRMIVGSYDDWQSIRDMVRDWAGMNTPKQPGEIPELKQEESTHDFIPEEKPETEPKACDHEIVMKMVSG